MKNSIHAVTIKNVSSSSTLSLSKSPTERSLVRSYIQNKKKEFLPIVNKKGRVVSFYSEKAARAFFRTIYKESNTPVAIGFMKAGMEDYTGKIDSRDRWFVYRPQRTTPPGVIEIEVKR